MSVFNHLPLFKLATLYVWLQLLDCENQLRELQVHGTSAFHLWVLYAILCFCVLQDLIPLVWWLMITRKKRVVF